MILHWSYGVRNCFINILLFCICETVRRIVVRYQSDKTQKSLTIEERLLCWAYIMIVRNFQTLGIPPVFPTKFETVAIRKLLSRKLSNETTNKTTLLWNMPCVLPKKPVQEDEVKVTKPREKENMNNKMLVWPFIFVLDSRLKVKKNVKTKETKNTNKDVVDAVKDFDPSEYVDPRDFLPLAEGINPNKKCYLQLLLQEMPSKQEAYKLWIMSGEYKVSLLSLKINIRFLHCRFQTCLWMQI